MQLIRVSSAAALVVGVILASSSAAHSAASAGSSAVTPRATAAPTALPLYEFTKSGTGSLPWTANSLAAKDDNTDMIAGPTTAASAAGVDVIAFTTVNHTIGYLSEHGTTTTFSVLNNLQIPPVDSAPTPFFDGAGHLNFVYVSTASHVILVTQNPTNVATLPRAEQLLVQPWLVSDLTDDTVTTANALGETALGNVAAAADGTTDDIALRSSADHLVVLTVPDVRPFSVSSAVVVGPTVVIASDPVFVGAPTNGVDTIASTAKTGSVDVFRNAGGTWSSVNLTAAIKAPTIAGNLAATANATDEYIVGSSIGSADVELDTYDVATSTWVNTNLTTKTAALATPGPALGGELTLTLVGTTVTVGGSAVGWGDLFEYADTGASASWVATDVSATGGTAARTVGSGVSAIDPGDSVTYYAGGVSTPARAGVGIYDIPYGDLSHVVSDGWPILADTGGLGTQSAPWTNVPAASAVSSSSDFQIGDVIQTSKKRETWLSFWTVSGPTGSEAAKPADYEANAYSAGRAVAASIDQYAADGLGLKPDWVILDPEGYPDNHSQLDGYDVLSVKGTGHGLTITTTSSTALVTGDLISLAKTGFSALNIENAPITVTKPDQFTIASTVKINVDDSGVVLNSAVFAANWTAMMNGWRTGIASVDTTLNAAIYVDEYEYVDGKLASTSMPVFVAIAWGTGADAPEPVAHSSNVLGFIEFGNRCVTGTVQRQLTMFDSAPWNGRYNTVQFEPPGYCTPTTP